MVFEAKWRNKWLQDLEKEDFGDPMSKYTGLINRVLQLRRLPLNTFTVGDLRLMIGQKVGLKYLVPLALEVLREDILVEGDYYKGDLLVAVSSLDEIYWKEHPDYRNELIRMIQSQNNGLNKLEDRTVKRAIESFLPDFINENSSPD